MVRIISAIYLITHSQGNKSFKVCYTKGDWIAPHWVSRWFSIKVSSGSLENRLQPSISDEKEVSTPHSTGENVLHIITYNFNYSITIEFNRLSILKRTIFTLYYIVYFLPSIQTFVQLILTVLALTLHTLTVLAFTIHT